MRAAPLGLQAPIGDGAGDAVGFFDVGLGDGEVTVDHAEGGMTEHALQGKDVAAVFEELDGKGVAKAVDGGTGYSGSLTGTAEEAAQCVSGQGLVCAGDEEVFGVAQAFDPRRERLSSS